jgi:hypothetical protein
LCDTLWPPILLVSSTRSVFLPCNACQDANVSCPRPRVSRFFPFLSFPFQHLTASSATPATCPTCKTPTRMDRDVVQVFGRPKVVPADAPWTSGAGSGASTCSFGPMTGGNPSLIDLTMHSQPSELPGPIHFDDKSPYLVAQNQIYIPAFSVPHSREMSMSRYRIPSTLGLDIDLGNPVISPSPEAALLPPPPSSPILASFELSSSPLEHSPIDSDADRPSDLSSLPFQLRHEQKRRSSMFSWLTASGTSGPGSMQLSHSESSLCDGESSNGSRSRSNTIDLRDEDDNKPQSFEPAAPTPRRMSLTSRPMKGFWATKSPVRWLPPKEPLPEEELPAPPRIEIRRATYPPLTSESEEISPRRTSRLRTRGWRPGSSVFSLAPPEPHTQTGTLSASDSDEYLSRFRPQWYDYPSGGEPPLSRGRTPSRKVFRNMDVDFAYEGQETAAAAREAAHKGVDDEQNPLGRAMMLLALALFLMVLLK